MVNLIQPITVQQAYDGITHARRWASWNWWWRMVDDDDSNGFPSPKPRTDSTSALPREIRAWWQLHIVKGYESFSLICFLPEREYMELELRSVEHQGAHEAGGVPTTLVDRVWPPWSWFFRQYFLLIPKIFSVKFQVIRRTFISTMAILLKTASVRVSSIQIMQVRVQNKGKNVRKSRYDGDVS